MSFRKLDAATMIAISDPLVDPEKDRPLLESYPMTAGLVAVLMVIHSRLLKIRNTVSDTIEKARQLSAQAKELNARYDVLYRSIYSVLGAWCVSASSEARRVVFEKTREILFPEGLSGVQRTYLSSAGLANQAMSQVTPEIETILREIGVDGRSLFEMFMEWVNTGRKLGEVARQQMLFPEERESSQVSAGDVQTARFRWIRFMKALRILLELDDDAPSELKARVLQPLQVAERKYSDNKSGSEESDSTDESSDEDNDSDEHEDGAESDGQGEIQEGDVPPEADAESDIRKPDASLSSVKAAG